MLEHGPPSPLKGERFHERWFAIGAPEPRVAQRFKVITSAPLQPNAGPQRFFEILGTNGTAKVQPLEQPALTIDLGKAAGPYSAGRQEVKLPPYRRYADEFAELASAIREQKALSFSIEMEINVHEALMRACEMI